MPRRRKEVETALTDKGFKLSETHHHRFIYWDMNGKKSAVFTRTSHSGKDIHDGLLSQMAKQCCLRNSEFSDLINCPMSREQYEALLREKGHIDAPTETPDEEQPVQKRKRS